MNCACTLLLPLSLAATVALAAPAGELDPAFGDHGRVLLRQAPFEELGGLDVFVDPVSAKLTVIGVGYGGDRLLRFNSDGSLDPGFGEQGTALLGFGDDDLDIDDVQWLPGGELLIAGAMNVYDAADNSVHRTALLARLHADGTPDPSFGEGGRATVQFGGEDASLSNVLLQPDGSIVVLGYSISGGNVDRILARFTANGAPDGSFGNLATPGFSVLDFAGIDASVASIVQQSDGNFLVCGDTDTRVGDADLIAVLALRISPEGLPDLTFGNSGLVLIDGWQDSVDIRACLELADGHLVFAGSSGSEERQRAAAWRVTPDGRLDAGFGTNGMMVLDTDTPSSAATMIVMANGTIALAGAQWKPSAEWQADNNPRLWWSDMLVARIDPASGEIDRAFGNRGATVVDLGAGTFSSNAYSATIIQQPDGKLVVIGSQVDVYDWWYSFSIAVARVDPYGAGSNGRASMVDNFVRSPAAGGDMVLRLRRTGGGTGQLAVDYQTVADTATAGEDYVEASGTVVWPDGDFSDKTITVTALDTESRASSERLTVELSNSSGGLGLDRAAVYIDASESTRTAPPVVVSHTNAHGGGAIGIELWLLSLLVLAIRGRKGSLHA